MKHPTEDHSLFGIDLIDELVEKCLQQDNNSEDISDFARDTKAFDCLRSIIDEADCDNLWEVHDLSDSKDDNIDLADLSQEAKLLKLMDQVCKHEDLECSTNAEVHVSKTKKLFPAQVATMFTTKYESAKSGRGQEEAEVNLTKKTSVKTDLIMHTRAESNSASEDQKQARAKSVSDIQVQNHVPSRSDSSTRKNAESDSNPTKSKSIPINRN
ncbi:hypothetical protein CR513_44366, partial [Mucuna pruriens]